MRIRHLNLRKYYNVTDEMAVHYPDGSVVKELWKLQKSGVIRNFMGDVTLEIIAKAKDLVGNNRPVVTINFGYMFETENHIYALSKETQDFRRQVLLSVFNYIYPSVMVIHDYGKVLKIIKEIESG